MKAVVEIVLGSLAATSAFVMPSAKSFGVEPLQMGLFDSLQKAFQNEEVRLDLLNLV